MEYSNMFSGEKKDISETLALMEYVYSDTVILRFVEFLWLNGRCTQWAMDPL